MRIIQIIGGLGTGGADRVMLNLGARLKQLGHEVIFATAPHFLWCEELRQQGYENWHINNFRGLDVGELRRFIRQTRADDFVIIHDSCSRHFVLKARIFGLRSQVCLVRHCLPALHSFGASLLHRCLIEHQVTVSDAVRDGVVRSGYPRSRTTRIYPGIETLQFLPAASEATETLRRRFLGDFPAGGLVIGLVARFHAKADRKFPPPGKKGHGLLFQALRRVQIPCRVLLLGPNCQDDRDMLLRLARHYGADPAALVFAGFVKDIAPFYSLMDINVLPSRGEGLGLALVEGMAAGVCSVGAAVGGMKEVITDGQTGLLFNSGDAASLADCLDRLASDPRLRVRLGRAGQQSVLERFNSARMAAEFDGLLRRSMRVRPGIMTMWV